MVDDSNLNRCPICGGAQSKGEGPGTITQWMFICNCQAKQISDSGNPDDIEVCEKCGKTKKTNRAGTLTQWIFKPDFCNCDEELLTSSKDLFSNIKSTQIDDVAESIEENIEVYIEVSSDILPTDRYKVIEIQGKGGTGTVYKCRDTLLNKLVAVKSLSMYTPDQVVAFQMEAIALSRLNHPNIVKVIDFGITEAQSPYMVMELFDGYSLDDHLKKYGPIPVESTIDLFIAIARGIEHAHQNEIYHRDLKPSNILISISESTITKVMVIDFGVAALSSIKSSEDSQGKTLVGTPAYMSPDQAEGKNYDARSEIYSIGVLLFECLTGKVPFEGETALDTINQHSSKPPPRLSELNTSQNYPIEMEEVVAKCLEKSPDRRFQSIEEFRLSLNNVFQSSKHALPDSQIVKTKAPDKKRIAIICIAAFSLLALAVPLMFYVIGGDSTTKSKRNKATKKKYPLLVREAPKPKPKFTRSKTHSFNAFNASSDVTDDDLIELAKSKTIRALDLAGSKITGDKLDVLLDEPVMYINFSSTKISDKAFDTIKNLQTLRILRFEHVPLTDKRIDIICSLSKLRILDLENTGLTDSQLKKVCDKLPHVYNLDLQSNPKLSQKGFLYLLNLKHLESLHLTNSNITKKTLTKLLDKLKSIKTVWILNSKFISQNDLVSLGKAYPNCKFQGQPLVNELGSVMFGNSNGEFIP